VDLAGLLLMLLRLVTVVMADSLGLAVAVEERALPEDVAETVEMESSL
jgi:hypothetical protein